jgi:hypothetical protein
MKLRMLALVVVLLLLSLATARTALAVTAVLCQRAQKKQPQWLAFSFLMFTNTRLAALFSFPAALFPLNPLPKVHHSNSK